MDLAAAEMKRSLPYNLSLVNSGPSSSAPLPIKAGKVVVLVLVPNGVYVLYVILLGGGSSVLPRESLGL